MLSDAAFGTSNLDDNSQPGMAYAQFGYTACPTVASTLTTSQLLMSGSSTTPTSVPATSCCESGRPIMTDPQTGQTICSCQYSSSLLASTYPRVAGLTADSVYGSAAYTAQGYVPFGTDPSAFYSPLNPAYDLKEGDWRSLAHPTPCYPYDPTMGGYPYGQSALAQRKNATREATSTLKAWLQEHIKNPYPTKGEKIMLAIITKMTLTQVSTWFANARRRLKKENKMTWSPRNRTDEDGNKIDSDDEDEQKSENNNESSQENKEPHDKDDDIDTGRESAPLNVCVDDASDILSDSRSEHGDKDDTDRLFGGSMGLSPHHGAHTGSHPLSSSPLSVLSNSSSLTSPPTHHPSSCMGPDSTSQKPRIWSLADVATSNSKESVFGNNNNPTTRTSLPPLPQTMPQPAHLGPSKLTGANPALSLNGPSSDPFNPSFNGFRPWINGAGEYATPPPQHTGGGPTSQPSTTNANLLRPYPLTAPRQEVH